LVKIVEDIEGLIENYSIVNFLQTLPDDVAIYRALKIMFRYLFTALALVGMVWIISFIGCSSAPLEFLKEQALKQLIGATLNQFTVFFFSLTFHALGVPQIP